MQIRLFTALQNRIQRFKRNKGIAILIRVKTDSDSQIAFVTVAEITVIGENDVQ